MNARQICLALFALASLSAAKFQHTYSGAASYGVQSCIANSDFTSANITLKHNCGPAFACILESLPNDLQTIMSSGSAILSFIPTVLLVLGNTNEEVIRISTRFPLLAFFLSITSINKRSMKDTTVPTPRNDFVFFGPYGFVRAATVACTWRRFIVILLVHLLALSGAAAVIWQTVDLGRNAVVSWACWTDFYPILWLCLAVTHHLIAVVFLRLSLSVSALHPGGIPNAKSTTTQSGLAHWNLVERDRRIDFAHKRLARWSKAFADFLNNINYLYGTAIFSSLTLVSGHNAIKILVVYGAVAVLSRIVAVWVLEQMD